LGQAPGSFFQVWAFGMVFNVLLVPQRRIDQKTGDEPWALVWKTQEENDQSQQNTEKKDQGTIGGIFNNGHSVYNFFLKYRGICFKVELFNHKKS
jgi:hypothetical protein